MATTTVAAGVNLPVRAVIVRDTQVGLDELNVATVLQTFGRAGVVSRVRISVFSSGQAGY